METYLTYINSSFEQCQDTKAAFDKNLAGRDYNKIK